MKKLSRDEMKKIIGGEAAVGCSCPAEGCQTGYECVEITCGMQGPGYQCEKKN